MEAKLDQIGALTLFVADPQQSKGFYEKVFGVSSIFEDAHSVLFKFGSLMVGLLVRTEAPDLIGPAKVASREAGTTFQLTIFVKDVNGVCSELAQRGVKLLNGPVDRVWGMRTASFEDPDGHIWEIAQRIA